MLADEPFGADRREARRVRGRSRPARPRPRNLDRLVELERVAAFDGVPVREARDDDRVRSQREDREPRRRQRRQPKEVDEDALVVERVEVGEDADHLAAAERREEPDAPRRS